MAAVALACRVMVLTVFVGSTASKTMSRARFDAFRSWVGDLQPVLARGARPAAVTVVAIEAGITVLLAASLARAPGHRELALAGLLLAAGLLSLFAGTTALLLRRGTRARCMCFGSEGAPLTIRHVGRDLLLVCIAGLGIADPTSNLPPEELLLVIGIGLSIGMVTMFLDDINALLTSWPGDRGGVLER